jgi:hypothetical protein
VAAAGVGDGAPVVVGRRQAGAGGAGDRLEHEPGDRLRPGLLDRRLQRRRIVPRDVREVGEQRVEALAPIVVAADGEGAERQPVVARVASDHPPALGPPAGQVVGAGEADRRVRRLAAAAGEEHVTHLRRQPALDQDVVQPLAARRRPDRDDVRPAVERVVHGCRDLRPPVADVGDDRPAGAVEDPPPVGGAQPAPLPADDLRPPGTGDEVDPVGVAAVRGRHRGSRGRPSTRSPRMLRITFDVPPMIV